MKNQNKSKTCVKTPPEAKSDNIAGRTGLPGLRPQKGPRGPKTAVQQYYQLKWDTFFEDWPQKPIMDP